HRVGGRQRVLDLAAAEVVGTGQQVGADIGVLGQVLAGVRVDVDQRAVALPVLGCAVGEDDLRHAAEFALQSQQISIAEWVGSPTAAASGGRWLRVAVVELAAGSAREV